MARLTIKASTDGDATVYALSGSVTAGAGDVLVKGTSGVAKRCIFDWDDVILANSDGLREWSAFFGAFANGREVIFRRCRPGVVASFNMIPACIKGGRVDSLYGAFFCPECRKEHDRLLVVGTDVKPDVGLVRELGCPWCGDGSPELNLPEDEFFQILRWGR